MELEVQVPGLYRGIQVWQLLSRSGELSLEQISDQSEYPKASVLRMLNTLRKLNLVERDQSTKNYRANAHIIRSDIDRADFKTRVQQCLEGLSTSLETTAEWYEPGEEGMLLKQRSSPLNAEIYVAARAGFFRRWNSELDSVAAMGYAYCKSAPELEIQKNLWVYGPIGEHIPVDRNSVEDIIRISKKNNYMIDANYNSRGIKRISCAVSPNGKLAGIISLALIFTPTLESKLAEYSSRLRNAAGNLSES